MYYLIISLPHLNPPEKQEGGDAAFADKVAGIKRDVCSNKITPWAVDGNALKGAIIVRSEEKPGTPDTHV
jgi:hypothetical protein